MRRFTPLLALALALPAAAQPVLDAGPGPFGSLDLVGGPFPSFTPAGTDVGGALGYRFGTGPDVAVLLGYGAAVDDDRFPYPAETHLGATVGVTRGTGRAAWRLEASGLLTVSGSNTFAFPPDGGPTEVRGGPTVIERRARAGVTRYVRLAGGPVRVALGAGAFGAVRMVDSSTLIFSAGTADENAVGGETRTETSVGLELSLPIAIEVGRGASLTLHPTGRIEAPHPAFFVTPTGLAYASPGGQLALRLDL